MDHKTAPYSEAAVKAAVERFGCIDVLVNNAACFYAGYFEELTMDQIQKQFSVSVFGPMMVTRAVRRDRSSRKTGCGKTKRD